MVRQRFPLLLGTFALVAGVSYGLAQDVCVGEVSETADETWRLLAIDATDSGSPTRAESRNRIHDETFRLASRSVRGGSPNERDTVVHEVSAKALVNLATYDGRLPFHAWLRRMFRQTSASYFTVAAVAPVPHPVVVTTVNAPSMAPVIGLFADDVRREALPRPNERSQPSTPSAVETIASRPTGSSAQRQRPTNGAGSSRAAARETARQSARSGANVAQNRSPQPAQPVAVKPAETEFRREVLARHPELSAAEAREELVRLTEDAQQLLKWRDAGVADTEIAKRLGVETSVAVDRLKLATTAFNEGLAERAYAKRRYLGSRPNKTYEDFRRGVATLVGSQRDALRLLAAGRTTEEVRLALKLPTPVVGRRLVDSLHDALVAHLDAKPVLGPEAPIATASAMGPWPLEWLPGALAPLPSP